MPPPEYAFIASERASGRARRAVAALNSLGYDARYYAPESEGGGEARRARAVVFCDAAPDTERFIFDFTDDSNLELAKGAFAFTAATLPLAHIIEKNLRCTVEVIPEPLEGPRQPPRASRVRPRSRPLEWLARRAGLATDTWRTKLLWSGEKPDVEAIAGAYPKLKALGRELPLELHCVADPEVLDALLEQVQEDAPETVRLSLEAASPATLRAAREACDFVLLPGDARAERAALHAGRLPVGGDDPCEAIRHALAHPRETLERLEREQRALDAAYAPAVVARAWVRILMKGNR